MIFGRKTQRTFFVVVSLFTALGLLGLLDLLSSLFGIPINLETSLLGPILLKHPIALILAWLGIQLGRGRLV